MTASTKGTYEYRVTVTRIATGIVECVHQFTKKDEAVDCYFNQSAHWNHRGYLLSNPFDIQIKRIHIKPEVVAEAVAEPVADPDADRTHWEGLTEWVVVITDRRTGKVTLGDGWDTRRGADEACDRMSVQLEISGTRNDYYLWTESRYTPPAPVVGMGATVSYPQDKYPYQVVGVLSPKCITVMPIDIDHLDLTRLPDCNGYPVYDHTFTKAQMDASREGFIRKARLHKDGYFYTSGGTRLHLGCARYYRNYAE